MSQITTHILDTSIGKPAEGVEISLYKQDYLDFQKLAVGTTNADGRVTNLLDVRDVLPTGIYKLKFETQHYFKNLGITSFYPFVEIIFQVNDGGEHYHVPLLLNPFGYSTYRGS